MQRDVGAVAPAAKAPAGPAPRPAAPSSRVAPLSASSLLAIQRAAGNQAALTLVRSSAGGEPIRRAWREGPHIDEWDAIVAGLQWERRTEPALEFRYWVDDATPAGIAATAVFQEWQNEWHPAAWWRDTWAQQAVWPVELEAVDAPAAVVDVAPVNDVDDEPDDADDVVAAPVAPDAAAATARLADPAAASASAPQYAPGGRFSWVASMTTAAAAQPSRTWIIQQVDRVLDGVVHERFWEAFVVPANQTTATDRDEYVDPDEGRAASTSTVRGVMQHHAFDGTGAPPGFTLGAGDADGEQLAATVQPAFWGAGGTTHDLTVVWDDGAGTLTFTTVPACPAPVRRASHTDFT